jgi:K+-transporting ATPase A subunit
LAEVTHRVFAGVGLPSRGRRKADRGTQGQVWSREKTFLDPVLRPVERLVYRLTGIDEKREMRWTEYAVAMLLFSCVSMVLLYLIEPAA